MISGGGYMWAGDAIFGVKDLRTGSTINPGYSREAHVMLGFGMAAALFVLCLAMPRWPLHPIGLLAVQSWVGKTMWPSILVGWLIKQVMVRYGGARLYRSARPFFLGLIIGEVFSASVNNVFADRVGRIVAS